MSQSTDKPRVKRSTRGRIVVEDLSLPPIIEPTSTKRAPASKGELKQVKRVIKKEKTKVENQQKNRIRVQTGKKTKADPGSEHVPSIWQKTAEDKLYHQLREMGDTYRAIDKFQRKRVMISLFVVVLGVIAGMYLHMWLYLAGPIGGIIVYKLQLKTVNNYYRGWKFQRQLNFSKFTRLVIPYLKAKGGNTALYTVFSKILSRTEDETDKRNLYQLMGEMGDNPSSIQPFIDYAERSSGTDMSHLFMSTIFDFQQSTFDVSVIDELGKLASDDMMASIDEIIGMKLKRFGMFPTKVVMSSFILVAGLGVGMMIHNFKDIGFSGNMLDPISQMNDTAPQDDAATDKTDNNLIEGTGK